MQTAERAEIARAVSGALVEAAAWWLMASWYFDSTAAGAYQTQSAALGGAVLASLAVTRGAALAERISAVRSGRWAQAQAEAQAAQDAQRKAQAGDPAGIEVDSMTLRQLATAQELADAEGRHSDRARIEARMTALIEASRQTAFQECEHRRQRRKQDPSQ